MLTGFVTLIGTLLSIVFYVMQRSDAKSANPINQAADRYETIDKDIAERDSLAASAHASDDLDLLDRLQVRQSGQR
jgi:hypothetical protein